MQLDFNYTHNLFIIAVSGGVDSVSLLHALVHNNTGENRFIIAHVDHGIRHDSHRDMDIVRLYADTYQIPFEYTELNLGGSTSEAQARTARYSFLESVMKKHNARAIITAHNQDDVIETMFINVIRGTGRRGLSSLKTRGALLRPLLAQPKSVIYEYAQEHKLTWREDSTNTDMKYLRNVLRHKIIAKMDKQQRTEALKIIDNAARINQLLDRELAHYVKAGLHKGEPVLNRRWFAQQSHDVALEVMHYILCSNGVRDINRAMIERTVVAVKTMRPGKTLQLSGGEILFTKRSARIKIHRKTDEYTV